VFNRISQHLGVPADAPTADQAREAAAEVGVDWRLLAAIGYQESHWNPRAVSPTGVRGIMMLTLNTARFVGIDNRIDPRDSIFGGARFELRGRGQFFAIASKAMRHVLIDYVRSRRAARKSASAWPTRAAASRTREHSMHARRKRSPSRASTAPI
jgi:hypothetical protein